jgi:hypothetical protein
VEKLRLVLASSGQPVRAVTELFSPIYTVDAPVLTRTMPERDGYAAEIRVAAPVTVTCPV